MVNYPRLALYLNLGTLATIFLAIIMFLTKKSNYLFVIPLVLLLSFLTLAVLVNLKVIRTQRSDENEILRLKMRMKHQTRCPSLNMNYFNNSSELCEIGKKYDTDKSSQRNNVTNSRHCPYTLFYESLFKAKRKESLKIAELGIAKGASLLMWREYFTKSEVYGFEYDTSLLREFKERFDNTRISLATIDVTNKDSIRNSLGSMNTLYDIIIEDTTHQFEDQIRVIENAHRFLKAGGIMIIEDIFQSYDENDYLIRLAPILQEFQDYYFVSLDHANKNSTGWDNDKLFVLVKNGAAPIFKNTNKITIITPSYRTCNLLEIEKSINFDYVDEWIIVYDGSRVQKNPGLFADQKNPKIKEYVYRGEGISGNPQRNYALTKISNPDTTLYYLDDDNVIHPELYDLLNIIDNTKMYTFNQHNGLRGNNVKVNAIDTAMLVIPYNLCRELKWIPDRYNADGHYIAECYRNNKHKHVYVDNSLCYYNKLA